MEYKAFTEIDTQSAWYRSMCALHRTIFWSADSDSIAEELSARAKFLILIALDEDRVVGYKIGYQDRATRFYSWLGGVAPNHRGQGIASELMRRQHEWCQHQGYAIIRTHTKNRWRNMLILNLRHSFDVIGTYTDGQGEPKIMLEKRF